MKQFFLALRPWQWIKNLFIFLPLIFGGKLLVFPANLMTVLACILFSLAAGVSYLVNDIIDAEKDKLHPTKSNRPVASGKVSKKNAAITALILGVISIVLSFKLNINFGWVVVLYLIFNLIYSVFLKDIVIIDVFCIGGFFLLRIMAGSAVTGIELSHWILIMTVLLALFLGFNKRRQELKLLEDKAKPHRFVLTKYSLYFIDQMITVITSSLIIAYMLYAVDAKTVSEFGTRNLMYSVPFVYYGIFRYLYLIHKVKIEGDPTLVLLSDKMMQINIVLWIGICISVIYFGF